MAATSTAREPVILVAAPAPRTPRELADAFRDVLDGNTMTVSGAEWRAYERDLWARAKAEFLGRSRNELSSRVDAMSERVDAMEKRFERLVDLTTTLIAPTQDNARKTDG